MGRVEKLPYFQFVLEIKTSSTSLLIIQSKHLLADQSPHLLVSKMPYHAEHNGVREGHCGP